MSYLERLSRGLEYPLEGSWAHSELSRTVLTSGLPDTGL